MGGRPCQICASAANMKIAAEMIAAGSSDQKIADKLGLPGNAGRMVAARHRKNHVEAPARAVAEAAGKGLAVCKEREQLVASAESGDAAAQFIGLQAITADLVRVRDRLERTAADAETGGARLAVAALAAQQHKSAEVRAKLGTVGGYAPPKTVQGEGGASLVINFMFSNRTERIEFAQAGEGATVVDALPDTPDEDDPAADEDV